jgi:hypothetical protein
LVVIVSAGEVQSLMAGTIVDHLQISTPIFIKLAKDIVLWLAILYFFVSKRAALSYSVTQIVWWLLMFLVGLSISLSILGGETLVIVAAGLRWIAPILLFIGAIGLITKTDIAYIETIIMRLFIVHFAMQIIELFFAAPYFGLTSWGLNLRNPGLFMIPNTGGLFTVLAAFFYLNFSKGKFAYLYVIVFMLSALLTASGAAIVTLLIVFFIHFAYRYRHWWVIFSPFVFALVFWSMSLVLSNLRGDEYVSDSLGTRLGIINSQIMNTDIISDAFGSATNTAVLLEEDSSRIVDSTYASVMANLGWVGFSALLFAFIYALYWSEKNKSSDLLSLICFCILAGFTTILFELYPLNFILPILFAYYFSQRLMSSK